MEDNDNWIESNSITESKSFNDQNNENINLSNIYPYKHQMIQKEKRKFSKGNLNNGNSKLLCLIQLNLINYLDERNPIPLKVSKPTNSFTSTEELRPGTDAATYKIGDDPLSIIMKQMQGLNQELTTLKSTINQK